MPISTPHAHGVRLPRKGAVAACMAMIVVAVLPGCAGTTPHLDRHAGLALQAAKERQQIQTAYAEEDALVGSTELKGALDTHIQGKAVSAGKALATPVTNGN